uniref:Uncharacterized protein n=1 Tax=Anguilla anguilla TaxID=7936 RepID=A0A0E9PL43_ANGAN
MDTEGHDFGRLIPLMRLLHRSRVTFSVKGTASQCEE